MIQFEGDAANGRGRVLDSKYLKRVVVSKSHPKVGIAGVDLVLPDGQFVQGRGTPIARLRFRDWTALTAYLTLDQVALFEHYLDGRLDLEVVSGDAAETLLNLLRAFDEQSVDYRWLTAARYSSRFWWQQNTSFRRKALSAHYSIPAPFWLSFLSPEYPIYSHYVFEEHEGPEAWEKACERKLQFAMDSCRIKAGDRVLNIGEGWGGFLTYAGRRGVRLTGITLNDDSFQAATAKLATEGLSGQCSVVKTDFYHLQEAPFDAITNMGVTEHLTDYDALMRKYAEMLKPGGYVYSDFVGSQRDAPFRSMIQKHVYPGATAVYLPKLLDAVHRQGALEVVQVLDDRLSYDKTCQAWARNVEAVHDTMAASYGENRYRWMWSYLWMSVYGLREPKIGLTGTRVVLRRR